MPARNRKWPMTPLLLQFNLLWLAKGGGGETRRLMNGKLDFVRIFVWDVFHLRWRGKFFFKWCIIRHQNPPQYNSPLMTDRVEIRPWRDRHQFNGNCIVFFMRKPQSEKQYREEMSLRNAVRIMEMWWWIWKGIVQHFLPLLCCISEVVHKLASLFLIMRGGRIQHPGCQNGTEGCFVLVPPPPHPPPTSTLLLNTPKLFLICGCNPTTPRQFLLPLFSSSSLRNKKCVNFL